MLAISRAETGWCHVKEEIILAQLDIFPMTQERQRSGRGGTRPKGPHQSEDDEVAVLCTYWLEPGGKESTQEHASAAR